MSGIIGRIVTVSLAVLIQLFHPFIVFISASQHLYPSLHRFHLQRIDDSWNSCCFLWSTPSILRELYEIRDVWMKNRSLLYTCSFITRNTEKGEANGEYLVPINLISVVVECLHSKPSTDQHSQSSHEEVSSQGEYRGLNCTFRMICLDDVSILIQASSALLLISLVWLSLEVFIPWATIDLEYWAELHRNLWNKLNLNRQIPALICLLVIIIGQIEPETPSYWLFLNLYYLVSDNWEVGKGKRMISV